MKDTGEITVTVTLSGPGAEDAADEIGQALEDLRDSGEVSFEFSTERS